MKGAGPSLAHVCSTTLQICQRAQAACTPSGNEQYNAMPFVTANKVVSGLHSGKAYSSVSVCWPEELTQGEDLLRRYLDSVEVTAVEVTADVV